MTLHAKLERAKVDAELLHAVIHGGPTDPDVITEGGPVPTLAKKIAGVEGGGSPAEAIHAATEKTTVDDEDELAALNSVGGFALVKVKWLTLKFALVTYFSSMFASKGEVADKASLGDLAALAGSKADMSHSHAAEDIVLPIGEALSPAAIGLDPCFMVHDNSGGNPIRMFMRFVSLWDWIMARFTTESTIAGAKTWTGQQELTGQTAANGTSAMTRDLVKNNVFQQCTTPLAWNTPTGTANTTNQIAGNTIVLTVTGPAAVPGNYQQAFVAQVPFNRNGSGANLPLSASRFSAMFEFVQNGITAGSNEHRFLFGVGSAQSLAAAGLGVIITGNNTAKLQIHNGSGLSEKAISIPTTASSTPSRMLVTWDGSKLVLAWASDTNGVFPRFTKIDELIGTAIPANCGGQFWSLVNIATGVTSFGHTIYLRQALFTPYVVTL